MTLAQARDHEIAQPQVLVAVVARLDRDGAVGRDGEQQLGIDGQRARLLRLGRQRRQQRGEHRTERAPAWRDAAQLTMRQVPSG